jgi:hypothetical protein
MKKVSFSVKKWSIRALVAIGALLGISACCHTKKVVEDDNYNYNYNHNNTPPIHNLKYGPLVDIRKSRTATIKKRIDENGNVVYDTIQNEILSDPPVIKPLHIEDE